MLSSAIWTRGLSSLLPTFPQASKREGGAVILQMNEIGLLGFAFFLPLVKLIRDHQAASSFKGAFEGRFFGDRFSSGIDHAVANFGVFRPRRNQSPA